MEDAGAAVIPRDRTGFRPRLIGSIGLGFVASLFAATTAGWLLSAAGRLGFLTGQAPLYRAWLASGGWLRLPLGGAALAALAARARAERGSQRVLSMGLAAALGALAFAVRTADLPLTREPAPRTARAKAHAILRWSYRTPETVLRIVALSRDPDPAVREQAVLALGVNVVVDDIEHATAVRPSRYRSSAVRDSLRSRLLACLHDTNPGVRAEAARALWKAPLVFGSNAAAAETLAAILDHALDPDRPERLAWLALDAAAGAPSPALRQAASRFAAATHDTELARYARLAVAEHRP